MTNYAQKFGLEKQPAEKKEEEKADPQLLGGQLKKG